MPVDVETKVAMVTAAFTLRVLRLRQVLSDRDCHEVLADVAAMLPHAQHPDPDAAIDIVEKIIFSSPSDDSPGEPVLA